MRELKKRILMGRDLTWASLSDSERKIMREWRDKGLVRSNGYDITITPKLIRILNETP